MADEFGEKTEAPTAKRLKDARKKGDVLKSREFATALVALAGVAWLVFFGQMLIAACKGVMAESFQFTRSDVEDFQPLRPLAAAGWKLLPAFGTLFAIVMAAGVASSAALGSLQFNAGLMAPKGNRINPASGLKRIFGMNGWIELGKSLLKVALLGSIGGWLLMSSARTTLGLARANIEAAVSALGGTLTTLMIVMSMGLAAIAMIDVPLQMFQRMKKLLMSKQEQKDEHKESEGNPEVKAQIRSRQHAMLSRSTRRAVGEAHVVLTNPTHFAVALRYDRGRDQVPVVVAKGRGATALAIREIAGDMAVPILEYPMLARAIYYTSRENQEVRDDLYMAIATVLAFVFGLNEQMGGSAPLPAVDVPVGARFDENGAALN